MTLSSLFITWYVTSVSLLIFSKLPIGVEIDTFQKALVSAAVFGILNALLRPILAILDVLAFPITPLIIGLFAIVLNAIIFGLAAYLVTGFRLRWGVCSALIGAVAFGIINSLLYLLLEDKIRVFNGIGQGLPHIFKFFA